MTNRPKFNELERLQDAVRGGQGRSDEDVALTGVLLLRWLGYWALIATGVALIP